MPTKQLVRTTDDLPVAIQRALAPAQFEALERDLLKFQKLYECWNPPPELYAEEDMEEIRRALATLPTWRARWAVVDQPASIEFIAAESTRLLIAFPNSEGTDPELFLPVIANVVRAIRPSYVVLSTAVRAYLCGGRYSFLNPKHLVVELRRAERGAAGVRRLLAQEDCPLADTLAQCEADLPRVRRRIVENKRRGKIERAIWRRLQAQGREDEYEWISTGSRAYQEQLDDEISRRR